MKQNRDVFELVAMCRLLEVSRTGYLQWLEREPSERVIANRVLDAKVAIIHRQSDSSYGRPRIVRSLRAQGEVVGKDRVAASLKRQHLRPVYKRPYRVTTDSKHAHPIAPNIIDQRFEGWRPDQAWVADITYLWTDEGWLYLAGVLDLATRRLVGWSLAPRMTAQLVCDALAMAYWRRKPNPGLIIHSDRGSQYASGDYRNVITKFKMTQSMSGKGNCFDNAVMESFFKTLKVERVHRVRYRTRADARLDVVNWVEGFYNAKRLHSAIGYQSPLAYEHSLRVA
jgi:putative transposase